MPFHILHKKPKTVTEEHAEELARIAYFIQYSGLLEGTALQTFDRAYAIAKKFILEYPENYDWRESKEDYDEAVERFVREQLSKDTAKDTIKQVIDRREIEKELIYLLAGIGMDMPSNLDEILDFVCNDIYDSADLGHWNTADIRISLRRWMET